MSTNLLAGASWRCAAVPPDAVTHPEQLAAAAVHWYPATVPGTAASAVRAVEGRTAALARDFDAEDWWFVAEVVADGAGPWQLVADGLATVSEVWVDGKLIGGGESMFLALTAAADAVGPRSQVALRFRALRPLLARRRARGRWRSSLVRDQGLRWFRTSLLGRAPLYTGTAAPVGPWRAITLVAQPQVQVLEKFVSSAVHGSEGRLELRARLRIGDTGDFSGDVAGDVTGDVAVVSVGEVAVEVALETEGDEQVLTATVRVPDVQLWWPHTHGPQPLYPVTVTLGGQQLDWGLVGFRRLEVDRSDGGFAVSVNGAEVFCRGACWTPLDPLGLLPDPEALRATLLRVRAAGLNMLRVTGTMVYEDETFWRTCAELGVMVWQDAMLATLDPPTEAHFSELLTAELEQLCARLQGNPALVVLSGGSETEQQPVLLGLPADRRAIPAIDELVPALVRRLLPGVVHVSSSPSGGALPTHVGSGVAHYFGVGGYLRPFSDVRTSGVRFAAECLAFAVPPERELVDRAFGSAALAGHDPHWKAAVPRDRGASWDFEDVRDHYVRTVFEVDPFAVRRVDPERYLDLGRAAVCEAVTSTFSHWRRRSSRCGGALVLTLRDLEPGAGWGLLDSEGSPKAPYYALSRLCQPVVVLVNDEGLDGLRIELCNDGAAELRGNLVVTAHQGNGAATVLAELVLTQPAHSEASWSVDELAGQFLDVNHAYGFGPRTYAALSVAFVNGEQVLGQTVHLLGGPARALETELGLGATVTAVEGGVWSLTVSTRAAAQYVSIEVPGYLPSDSWFHLPPGGHRTVRLRPTRPAGARADKREHAATTRPRGWVRAVNATQAAPVQEKAGGISS